MDPFTLIDKYYAKGSPLYDILVTHSRRVAEKAQEIANSHPELEADENFLYEAAMLHDIGIYLTHAPDIQVFRYSSLHLPRNSRQRITEKRRIAPPRPRMRETCRSRSFTQQHIRENLPIPHRDMLPVSIEEQIICYAKRFHEIGTRL